MNSLKDIPVSKVQRVEVITKRSGRSVIGGLALLILSQYIVTSFLSTRSGTAPETPIPTADMFLLAVQAILFLIGIYFIIQGLVGTKHLKIFYYSGEKIEVKCNNRQERLLFIDAVNSQKKGRNIEEATI